MEMVPLTHRHDAWSACNQSIREQGRYSSDDRLEQLISRRLRGMAMESRATDDDGERDAKVMQQAPIASQLLFVTELGQLLLIHRLNIGV